MKINRIFKVLGIAGVAALSLLALNTKVEAGTIGVSPVSFSNKHLKPGQSYTQEFIISRTDFNEETNIEIEIDAPNIKDWFSFDPGESFTIPSGQERFSLEITSTVPESAALKSYTGEIRIVGRPKDAEQEGDVSIIPGVVIDIDLKLTSKDVVDLQVLEVKSEDSEEGDPIKISVKFKNNGNVDTAPTKITLNLQDLKQKSLEKLENDEIESIKAGGTKETLVTFSTDQEAGEYFGIVKVYYKDEVLWDDRVVINITEKKEIPIIEGQKEAAKTSNLLWILIIILFAGGSLILIIIAQKKREETEPSKKAPTEEKSSIADIQIPAPLLILILFSFTFIIVFALYQVISGYRTPSVEFKESEEEKVEEEYESTEVEGVKTSVVKDNKVYYKIFAENDASSEAIYLAKEGENFELIEESGDWYKIKLPHDGIGWVHVSSVKEEAK